MGDAEYIAAFQQIVMPVAYEVRVISMALNIVYSNTQNEITRHLRTVNNV